MIALMLLACAGDPKTEHPAHTGDPFVEDEENEIEEEWVCASPEVALSGADTAWSATTEHYAMRISGFDEAEALNLATLAETAWGGLEIFFGGAVEGPLTVVIAADLDGFTAALAEDGITGLEGAGGYYDPGGQRAYLYRQPTAYYSRVLMLHELVHQYQDLTGGLGALPTWYVEGLAEALSRHHWDGACNQLRVRPLLSWEDAAASALAEIEAGPPDLSAVLAGGAASRPLSGELVRLLAGDPDLAPGFTDWRDAVATGATLATDIGAFEAAIAPLDQVEEALLAFVPEDQEPLSPVWLDWIPEGADQARGFSELSSAARVKGELSRFSMSLGWPTGGPAGAVYGYDPSTGDLELALLSPDGGVSRFAVISGAVTWDVLGAVAVSGAAAWSQEAGADSTEITVGADTVTLPRALPPAGGLALYGAEAVFSDLSWE